jgi:hypothetical protein
MLKTLLHTLKTWKQAVAAHAETVMYGAITGPVALIILLGFIAAFIPARLAMPLVVLASVCWGICFYAHVNEGKFRYRIRKGSHYPSPRIWPQFIRNSSVQSWRFIIEDLPRYNTFGLDGYGTNKICGRSYRLLPKWAKYEEGQVKQPYWFNPFLLKRFGYQLLKGHHWNSVRMGWDLNDFGDPKAVIYIYNAGYRQFKPLHRIQRGIKNRVTILDFEGCAVAAANIGSKSTMAETGVSTEGKWGYTLGPYFGGEKPSPLDIQLYLKRR